MGAGLGVEGAGEDRLDLFLGFIDARVRIGLIGGVHDHVGGRLIPVLPELTTADSHHRGFVAKGIPGFLTNRIGHDLFL